MKEQILSREEVEALAHRICMKYEHSNYVDMRKYTFGILTLEQFAAALESALLEKLCGEPVAWRYPYRGKYAFYGIGDTVSSDSIEDSEPLYAINRSKA